MIANARRYWFLIALAVALVAGTGQPAAVRAVTGWIDKRFAVATVLLLMAVSLDSGRLWQAVRAPGPVGLAIAINAALLPLAAWGLSTVYGAAGLLVDLRIGLLIAASVPCTLASASVWTRKAKGDDAVTLVVTVVTNFACFVITPMWLKVGTGTSVQVDVMLLMERLALAVLLPTAAGQLLRTVPQVAQIATRHKGSIGGVGQGIILLVILIGSADMGQRLREVNHGFGWGQFLLIVASCLGLHLAALGTGLVTAMALRFGVPQQAAVAFGCSQKTLPIGVLLATDYFGAKAPLAILPMIVYHVGQLIADTAIAERLARRVKERRKAPPDTEDPIAGD